MKTPVAYLSQTGTTKRVAEAIYEAVNGEKHLKELGEVTGLAGYDLAFIGFPMHAGGAAQPPREWLAEHAGGRKIALSVLHASYKDGGGVEEALAKCREAAGGAELLGLFHCQGELSEQIAEIMVRSGNPDLERWGRRRAETVGMPDEGCRRRASEFARETTAKVE